MSVILRATNDDGVVYDLDVFEGDDFKLDISAIESGDIGKVFGVSSQTISLPPTENNNAFFGNAFDVGATPAVSFTQTVECQVLENGSSVFKGKMYLQDVITDNHGDIIYNVVVVNETVDFKFLIQDLTFADLDFSSLDHDYTYGNITSSWDGDLAGGGIFYPLVNYGFDAENPNDTQLVGTGKTRTFTNYNSPIRVDDFKPAIRLRDCFDAIFDKVGYTYTSSLFTSGSYTDEIYMLATKDDRKGITDVSPVSQSFRAYTTSSQNFVAPTIAQQVYFPAENYDNGGNFSNPTFTAGATGTYQFEINLVYNISGYSAVGDSRFVDVKIYKNGSPLDTYNFDLTGTVSGQMNLITQYYALTAADTIDVRLSFTKTGTGSETFVLLSSGNSRFKLINGPASTVGGTTNLAENFANIGVLDFLNGVIQKFNLVIEPDYLQRNVLKIETFNEWRDSGTTKDWSKSVDFSKKWKITHPLQGQPRDIIFSDVEDDAALVQYHKKTTNKIYGEYKYKSSSDLANGEKRIGTFFAPTPIKGIGGAPQTIVPTLATKEGTEPFERMIFSPRLLFRKPTRQPANGCRGRNASNAVVQNVYYFQDENGVIHEENNYGLGHHLQGIPADFDSTLDLHFGNSISPGHWSYHQPQFNAKTKRTAFTEYWSFYINELYDVDSRLVTCNIYLTPSQVQQIALNDRIHINGHYYRINKINGANISREDSVEVELIKELPRKSHFPRRRYIDPVDFTPVDITLDYDNLSDSGTGIYVGWDNGTTYTGSEAVNKAAGLDDVSIFGTTVVWDTEKPKTAQFTSQTNLGLNRVDESADIVDVRGEGNFVANSTTNVRVEGTGNNVESYAQFISITGTDNLVKSSVSNSTIQNSNTSSIENAELATIIAGDNTLITGSNKSVAIGQDVTVEGGNSNIVIGNYDTNTRTVKDLINTVVINPNRDLESWENLGGDDFNGRAYMGTQQTIGAVFRDNKYIECYDGMNLYLTGSEYANDYFYVLTWSGSAGTGNIYLPDTDPNNLVGRESSGYKRELRFMSDDTFDAGGTHKADIYGLGTDTIDSLFSPSSYRINKAYDGVSLYSPQSGSWFIIQKKA